MNKMLILLEQLHLINDVVELKSASIDKVVVNTDQSYVFYISAPHIISLKEVRLLFSAKKIFPYPCDFVFDWMSSYTHNDVLEYALFIFEGLNHRYPQIQFIKQENISFQDNTLHIEVFNEIQLNQIQHLYKIFDKYFNKFGIQIGFKAFIDENNEQYKSIQEELENDNNIVDIDLSIIPQVMPVEKKEKKPQFNSYKKNYFALKIDEIDETVKDVMIQGYIFKEESKKTKTGKTIQELYVTDYTNSIVVTRFENKAGNSPEEMAKVKKGGKWVRVKGTVEYNTFAKDTIITAREVEVIPSPKVRMDEAPKKRVELHVHSKMSAMDGIGSISDYISRAAYWGHEAIAVTDHGNVQSFPEAQMASIKNKIKMIYGVEMYMVDPDFMVVYNEKDMSLKDLTFVSFDLETTGLSVLDDDITEFGAVRYKNGQEVARLQSLIKPNKTISEKITRLTHISNNDVKDAPTIQEFLPKILEFFGDDVIVAHNATFDVGFLNEILRRNGYETLKNPAVDSLTLAWKLLPDLKGFRLGNVARYYRIPYDGEAAHRADYDADVLAGVFNMMLHDMMQNKLYSLLDMNKMECPNAYKIVRPKHMCVLAKDKNGLKNLFKLVAESNTTYFEKVARIPRSRLEFYREGLLFGSGCYNSEIFDLAMTRSLEELKKAISFYDYIEILPLDICQYFVERGRVDTQEDLIRILRRIVDTAKSMDKLIVATGDVHYVDQSDKIFRDVFTCNPKIGLGGALHPLTDRNNPHAWTPDEYLRTTQEMLDSFPYLTEEEKYEYVVENTLKISGMINGDFHVVHDKLFTPHIDNADENLRKLCFDNAHKQYGEVLPDIVEKRLSKELDNIIKHGFGVIYYIAHKLVKKSNDAGYLVGSRGSVGSSFVATMAEISEVNPLPPHYYCPHCQYNEFLEDGEIANGYDLPDKVCPKCGKPLKGDGHNIPFETFLGFNADKVPDIDLNFSGDYQPTAHAYTKEIFGESHVYRAGTISTVAEKTAYGYARGYAELMGRENSIRNAELERIAKGCTGVKRTTGQHPGGIIVIPENMDVYDFTPYQYPADDLSADWKTTHFDFHAIHDNVLKFDILGHVDPTVIRMLQDLTGVNPKDIPTNDKRVMSLFNTTKELGIDLSYMNCKTGALGLPEFGTKFVRGMLEQTHPTSFSDLVIISGLSHGTDVYLGNAETLISSGTCTLKEVIGCRDDIMVYLIEKGLPNKDAFDIMECVRKGKSPVVFPEKKYEELMRKHDVPTWYIESCKKIKYMFPKAHAAAYVLSAIRVAWWKLYYPREYYAVYFSTRCDAYDIEAMIQGREAVLNKYKSILNDKQNGVKISNKEEALISVFEIALEMFDRGYHFNNISLEYSDSRNFIVDQNDEYGILPPFTSVDGLGDSVGDSVVEARNKNLFLSKEDVIKRTRLNNTQLDFLTKIGVFENMSEENQLSLFDF
ncbi:MAG: PolC-type DNA polymerase III [Erysipelotrichales bacterium]|nr:PolC-type DNA polymerase III [Erysipelotrichales bacterium]